MRRWYETATKASLPRAIPVKRPPAGAHLLRLDGTDVAVLDTQYISGQLCRAAKWATGRDRVLALLRRAPIERGGASVVILGGGGAREPFAASQRALIREYCNASTAYAP